MTQDGSLQGQGGCRSSRLPLRWMKLYSRFSNSYLIGLGLKGRPPFHPWLLSIRLSTEWSSEGSRHWRTGDGLGEVSWLIKTRPGVMLIAGKLRPHAALCLIQPPSFLPQQPLISLYTHPLLSSFPSSFLAAVTWAAFPWPLSSLES